MINKEELIYFLELENKMLREKLRLYQKFFFEVEQMIKCGNDLLQSLEKELNYDEREEEI